MSVASVPDLYAVLGVPPGASEDEIRRAYRRLARELHPDVNGGTAAEQRFKEVTAAYEVLSNPEKRHRYDTFGTTGSGPAGPAVDFPFGADFADIFDVFFGAGAGRRRRGPRSRARAGEDAGVKLRLTFMESVSGVRRSLDLDLLRTCEDCGGSGAEPGTAPTTCPRCQGAGEVQDVSRSLFGTVMLARPCRTCEGTGQVISSPCHACMGEGRSQGRRVVELEVPAGVEDGMELRIGGAGHDGRAGGPPGDLHATITVEPHEVFERRGRDLVCALTVPMTQAALGGEVEIPTLEGSERVRLDAGLSSGTVLRLRGKGVPSVGRRGRGDLFVTVEVETPKPRTKEERELLERLAEVRAERSTKEDGGFSARLHRLLER